MRITQAVAVAVLAMMLASSDIDVVAGVTTKFSYPSGFPSADLSASGDAELQPPLNTLYGNNSWYVMDPVSATGATGTSTGGCGRVVYPDKVWVVDNATGTAASFKTAFTFSFVSDTISSTCGDGMVFSFYTGTVENKNTGGNFCVFNESAYSTEPVFAVEIDSFNNPWPGDGIPFSDRSDSHIAVDFYGKQNVTSCVDFTNITQDCNYQYNLCTMSESNWTIESCSFFCSNLSTTAYTIWIDYDSPQRLLEVRFRNGSLSNGVEKPAEAIITVPNLPLGDILDEETYYVGFTSSTGLALERHIIQAWEFESSGLNPGANSTSPKSTSRVALIASVSCGAAVMALVAGLSLYLWKRSHGSKNEELISITLEATETSRTFTYRELSRSTKNFSASELLASGAFGDVYRGTLPSGALVAIKRIKENKEQGPETFLAEATSLRQIRHRNLLQLRGWSHSREGLFLVYDYMSNSSLDKWIYRNPNPESPDANGDVKASLSWNVRQFILAGVASGLEYLHEGWVQCVLHRDIKSSNVMLDADFNAYVGDFGLARLTDHNKMQRTTLLAGTLGYLAPEMMHTGRATKETDVYAFGIVVLEVVCGRRPLDTQTTDAADVVLLDSVWRAHEAGDISRVADARLLEVENCNLKEGDAVAAPVAGEIEPNLDRSESEALITWDRILDVRDASFATKMTVVDLLQLGLLCCLPDPSERPSMRIVNRWFQSSQEGAMDPLPPLPATKPQYHQSYLIPLPTSSGNSSGSGGTSSWSQSSSSSLPGSTPTHTQPLIKSQSVALEDRVS